MVVKRGILVFMSFCLFFAGSLSAEVWMDDFERDELGEDWITFKRFANDPVPDWKVDDGVLKGCWPFWGCQLIVIEEYPSLNYTIQVDCRIDKIWMEAQFASAQIAFRVSGPDFCPSFYGFGISSFIAGFSGDPGCNANTVKAIPRIQDVGQWYTLRLVAQGDNFIGYVNDVEVCDLTDRSYKGEFVGLLTGANNDASFDNFTISDRVDDDAFSRFGVSLSDGALTTAWASLKAQWSF
jgi:hypothetical protein